VKQAGRKSAAELATVTALPVRLLQPPADLSVEEAQVWGRVAATKPGDWWDAGSIPLLAQYCRATVQAELLADLVRQTASAMLSDPSQLGTYKDLRKLQAALSAEMSSLARAMRLTQQSRYRADKADTEGRKANGRKPWQTHDVLDA
jgi:hypothetical protein